jgi:hypothetical protein
MRAWDDYFLKDGKMRSVLWVVALVILGSMAWGGQLVISSLPDTVYQSQHSSDLWDTITIAGTKLISESDGLDFRGVTYVGIHHWYLNLGTDTIMFGTKNGVNMEGIRIASPATVPARDITINGGWIIHNPPKPDGSDTTSSDNNCFEFGGNRIILKNVNMIAAGYNGKCIQGDGYDIEIAGGKYYSRVNYYRSRCQFDALIMSLGGDWVQSEAQANGWKYNIYVHDAKIYNAPHAAIRYDAGSGEQYGIFKISACSISVDARNFRYPAYDGTCASSANPYGIAVQYLGPGSEISRNVITSGSSYGGGRGILVERNGGPGTGYVSIHNNIINVHEGPNAEYSESHMESHALRIRSGSHHLHIYNNDIIMTGDANSATSSYCRSVTPFRYTLETVDNVPESFNIIENNHFVAKALDAGVTAYGICFDAVTIEDSTLIFRYNKIESNNILVKYGEINEGAKGITLYKDTLKFFTPLFSPQTYHVGHLCNNFDCSGNVARDNIYQGGASDTNIIISCASQGTMDFALQRTLLIKVQGNNGLPVTGASVLVTNNYKQTVINRYTAGNGSVSGALTYWWESRAVNDSLAFNNYSIKVKKDKDSTLGTINISAGTLPMTFTLTKTAGDGNWTCDTCNYICGDINGDGRVDLLDMNYLIMALYKGGPSINDYSIADVDNSGSVNLLDGQYIISFLYRNGPPLNCK